MPDRSPGGDYGAQVRGAAKKATGTICGALTQKGTKCMHVLTDGLCPNHGDKVGTSCGNCRHFQRTGWQGNKDGYCHAWDRPEKPLSDACDSYQARTG